MLMTATLTLLAIGMPGDNFSARSPVARGLEVELGEEVSFLGFGLLEPLPAWADTVPDHR
jgi:hypothetical protein